MNRPNLDLRPLAFHNCERCCDTRPYRTLERLRCHACDGPMTLAYLRLQDGSSLVVAGSSGQRLRVDAAGMEDDYPGFLGVHPASDFRHFEGRTQDGGHFAADGGIVLCESR